MDETLKNKSPIKPRRMEELLPSITALLTEDGRKTLSCKKKPCKKQLSCLQTHVTETNFKPMNFKELCSNLSALQGSTPKYIQSVTSTKKRPWNTSVKVNKTKSLTADGQMKHSTVRKTLKFQANARNIKSTLIPTPNNRPNMTSKVAKKSLCLPVQTGLEDISGVWKMPKTPVIKKSVPNSTKATNISFKSPNDESFIQTEKEINYFEEKANVLIEELTQEKVADICFEVSKNDHKYFNKSCNDENSFKDNTILCFDKTSAHEEKPNQENVMVSLCHMLKKATITNSDINNTKLTRTVNVERQTENNSKMLDNVFSILNTLKVKQLNFYSLQRAEIIEAERQTENNLKMLDNVISILNTIKEKQLILLQHIGQLKNEKIEKYITDENIPLVESKCETPIVNKEKLKANCSPTIISPINTSKPPSYKVRRKSISLKKKIICKSMMNASDKQHTPHKTDRALHMYMQIKEQMTFLNTPLNKRSYHQTPDTPTITSNNLQKQLEKLYDEN